MTIDTYFEKNLIVPKSLDEVSTEHRRVCGISDETEYFNEYFRTGVDISLEGVDFPLNQQLFPLVLEEAEKHEDLFEPCCQSGIFGCYIASETGKSYMGMDINPFGIEKAKERAKLNGLDPAVFVLDDILEYDQEHEAIVGRYVVNGKYHNVNNDMLEALNRISRNIVLIQPAQAHTVRMTIENHKKAFERHGYKFHVLNKPQESPATGAYVFVMKAEK